ncbi:MAG: choice-of-anchor Q domain-containing protein, partial [Verrucomicrobiota bacterium]
MKARVLLLAVVSLVFHSIHVPAEATHYVDLNCTNPVPPYISWPTAATNIQDAVSLAGGGDTILVTNGIYQYGGAVNSGSNRVYVLFNNVTVQSVNGPAVTVIKGAWDANTNGPNAVRCVYLTGGSVLSGFTLTNGATQNSPGGGGGGVYCSTTNCLITNCIITGNAAYQRGGGTYLGTVVNCVLRGNSATLAGASSSGGGAYGSVMTGSILTGNTTSYEGGGADNSTLFNCLICSNSVPGYNSGGGAAGGTLINCTVVGNSAYYGGGVFGGVLKDSIIYDNQDSVSGYWASNYFGGVFTNCATFPAPGSSSGMNNITNAPAFVNPAGGDFHLQPWSPCINAGNNSFNTSSTDLDGNPRIVGGTVDIGAYEYQAKLYVNVNNTNPVSPFTDWSIAATNIQDAIDVARSGDQIIVTNGVYQNGGRAIFNSMTNRVALDKPVTVQSINGPAVTVIQVYTINSSSGAMRCAYLTNGAVLAGFTLTNGSTRFSGDSIKEQSGGGVWCESAGATVSNCVIAGNIAFYGGAGAYGGTFVDCVLSNNFAWGEFATGYGGAAMSNILNGCTIIQNRAHQAGGGTYESTLNNCIVVSNSAPRGGGVYGGMLNNCAIINNIAANAGGGSYAGVMNNCVLAGNVVLYNSGGGASSGVLNNCIAYYNSSPDGINCSDCTLNYCCTTPFPGTGSGNFTNEPDFLNFANSDFHLQPGSFCINAGNNSYATNATDLDGNPRIVGSYVDVGAYEYQASAPIPLAVGIQVPYTKITTGYPL